MGNTISNKCEKVKFPIKTKRHEATVLSLHQHDNGDIIISCEPKMGTGEFLLKHDNDNFENIYNTLEIGKIYQFEYWHNRHTRKYYAEYILLILHQPSIYSITAKLTDFLDLKHEYPYLAISAYQLLFERINIRIIIPISKKDEFEVNQLYTIYYKKYYRDQLYILTDYVKLILEDPQELYQCDRSEENNI